MYLPKMRRNKGYISTVRKYDSEQIFSIIHAFTVTQLSMREIEVFFLGHENGDGYEVMQILHYYGLSGRHKGVFKEMNLDETILNLQASPEDTTDLCSLISQIDVAKNKYISRLSVLRQVDLDALPKDLSSELNRLNIKEDEKEAYINSYFKVRNPNIQKRFRDKLLREFKGTCALCEINNKSLLVAGHIIPYSRCAGDVEKISDSNNGILLCVLHDALFEAGEFITLVDGKIRISLKITKETYSSLKLRDSLRLDSCFLNSNRVEYLKQHNLMFIGKNEI